MSSAPRSRTLTLVDNEVRIWWIIEFSPARNCSFFVRSGRMFEICSGTFSLYFKYLIRILDLLQCWEGGEREGFPRLELSLREWVELKADDAGRTESDTKGKKRSLHSRKTFKTSPQQNRQRAKRRDEIILTSCNFIWFVEAEKDVKKISEEMEKLIFLSLFPTTSASSAIQFYRAKLNVASVLLFFRHNFLSQELCI